MLTDEQRNVGGWRSEAKIIVTPDRGLYELVFHRALTVKDRYFAIDSRRCRTVFYFPNLNLVAHLHKKNEFIDIVGFNWKKCSDLSLLIFIFSGTVQWVDCLVWECHSGYISFTLRAKRWRTVAGPWIHILWLKEYFFDVLVTWRSRTDAQ